RRRRGRRPAAAPLRLALTLVMTVARELRGPCPRCQQDWTLKPRLVRLERGVFYCVECEALWVDPLDVGTDNYVAYREFMEQHGVKDPGDPWNIELGDYFKRLRSV